MVSDVKPTRFENGRPMLLGGLRRRHEYSTAEYSIAGQWRQFVADGETVGRIGEQCFGVMCGADSTGFEYMCGVEVQSLDDLPDGIGRMRVPTQRYAVFPHDGNARPLRSTWQQAFEWLSKSEYESAQKPDFEVYGPRADPLSPRDGIEIWIGVVDRRPGSQTPGAAGDADEDGC